MKAPEGESQSGGKKIFKILIITLGLICVGFVMIKQGLKKAEATTLKVGFPLPWGNLTPALQHTAYADTIIKNQFEPLVRAGQGGKIEPLTATSWTMSSDYRVFTFKIDATKRFSDGTSLSARHFKEAWEHALSLQPKSANSSLQDLLYKIEGYEGFEKTKKLSGLTIPDDETLQIRFKSPFRMALDRLCGGRFGVFLIQDGKFLGTGHYVIEELGEHALRLTPNPFSKERSGYEKVEIEIVTPGLAENALMDGTIDVYASAQLTEMNACASENSQIGCLTGDEVSHSNLNVNGLDGRFFSNSKHRLALQALVLKELPAIAKPKKYEVNSFRWDSQVFLPVQAGRLSEEEVKHFIDRGTPFIDEFIKATQKAPLFYLSRAGNEWLMEFLKTKGIRFTENSGNRDFKTLINMAYKTHEPDLLLLSASVANGDPDGIYHFLGSNGAILFPMIYRKRVGQLLEEGRAIFDLSRVDEHYKKVARAVLEEVPFVHLGFDVDLVAFRNDRVRVAERVRNRKQFHFHIFEPL